MEKIVLIDGNSILNRAYYALPALVNREGKNVNAVLGFLNILLKALDEIKPSHIIVAFDKYGVNFRKKLYPAYKANRKPMPTDLAEQLPMLKNLLEKMSIKYLEEAGVEADDIIGTVSKKCADNTVILTSDRDLLQLIDQTTTVMLTKRGVSEVEYLDQISLKERYCLTPQQVVDYKALRGDASDNIPGVRGIGEKGASNLIQQFGNLDNIYSNIDSIKGAVRQKLIDNKEMAYLSKELATIDVNVKLDCNILDCGLPVFDDQVKKELEELEFRSIIKRLTFTQTTETRQEQKVLDTIIITQPDDLAKLTHTLLKSDQLALHFKNDIYLATQKGQDYKIQISDNFLEGISFSSAIKTLQPILNSDIPKTVYDGKAANRFLFEFDTEIKNIQYDIDLMQYLTEYRSIKNFESVKVSHGCVGYAETLLSLKDHYLKQLNNTGTFDLYKKVELPLSFVLYDMEKEGVKVDVDFLNSLNDSYSVAIEQYSQQVYLLAGETFNILSPKQLSGILFDKLGLQRGRKIKTGYSTDNDVLESLINAHPIVELILKIRQLTKLNGTYVLGLIPLIKNGLIHTHFNQTLTTTGRLSSSDPNLQNIPVRDEMGKEIRKAFLPKYDMLISADYSQIELRLLAYFSGDENLISAFVNGQDIHARVASEIFGIPSEMVTENMRRAAKAVNFGIIYGISDFGLSKNIGTTVSQARKYISAYFERYPKIHDYLHSSVAKVKAEGFVTTILGRRRYIPEIKSNNYALRSFGERAAMNMPLQGSAADLMKIAMINVYDRFKANKLKSKIILQIHDELIVDAYKEEEEEVKLILKEEMESAFKTNVPFDVDISTGGNLYETK